MKAINKPINRNPRPGETVFLWTGGRLETGRIIYIIPELGQALPRYHVYIIDQAIRVVCNRGDFALLPEIRHLIPRMRRIPALA